jgi:hypothetical protein
MTGLNKCDVKSGRTFVTLSPESDSVMIGVFALDIAAAFAFGYEKGEGQRLHGVNLATRAFPVMHAWFAAR